MIVYNAIYAILAFLRLGLNGNPQLRQQIYPFALVGLFLFSAFRYQVGCDWTGYWYQFDLQGQYGVDFALIQADPVWWLIIHMVHEFELPYEYLNIVSSAIFFVGLHALARRQPDPLAFLIFLFPVLILNMPMSAIRQAAAIGVLCFAFVSFLDNRVFRFVALVVLASSIHTSALAFLLLVPLIGGRYTISRLILAGILAIPGAYLIGTTESVDEAANRYIGSGLEAGGAVYRGTLLMLTGLGFFLVLNRTWRHLYPQDHRLANIGSLLMLALFPVLSVSTVIADRFGYYLIPIQAMIFVRIPYIRIPGAPRFYAIAPYVLLGVLLLVWTSLSSHFAICYIPYQNWMLGVPLPPGVTV